MSAASDATRVLLLQIVGPRLTEDEHANLADSLEGALPDGYSAVLMHREPRVEAMTREDVREFVRELESAAGLQERRPNARVLDAEEVEHGE